VLIPTAWSSLGIGWISDYSWFIGCGLGFVSFWYLERVRPIITDLDRDLDACRDGSSQAVMSGVTVGAVTANAGAVTAGGETAPEPA
jgi:NCS1 family nucleobase:cation symporter-1